MPSFSDNIIPVDSNYRQSLLKRDWHCESSRRSSTDAPVPSYDQVYVGQRPFEGAMAQPILVSDLRQLHLRNAQLYMGGVWNWVSWNPAGPKSLQMWDLYFYKAFETSALR